MKQEIVAQVSGIIGDIFPGSRLVVEVNRAGAQYPDRVTVWAKDLPVVTGDSVTLRGVLSWRREVKGEKTYFNVSLNDATVVAHVPVVAVSAELPF